MYVEALLGLKLAAPTKKAPTAVLLIQISATAPELVHVEPGVYALGCVRDEDKQVGRMMGGAAGKPLAEQDLLWVNNNSSGASRRVLILAFFLECECGDGDKGGEKDCQKPYIS